MGVAGRTQHLGPTKLNKTRKLRAQVKARGLVNDARTRIGSAPASGEPDLLVPIEYRTVCLTQTVSVDTLFSVMRNGLYSETILLDEVTEALRDRLPTGWFLGRLEKALRAGSAIARIDAVLTLTDPRGESATIIVEAKGRPLEARMVSWLQDQWQQRLLPQSRKIPGAGPYPSFMVISPFLGPSAKERLADAGISYADAAGNMRFVTDRPAAFIQTEGAVRNPWRENVPLRSLQGRRSARVVRAFLDYCPPFGTRELAALTKNAPASISRVSDLLERDGIIERASPRGAIISVDWQRLLRRWAVDYDFSAANRMIPCLEPRGLSNVFGKLRDVDFTYAVTGSFAANRYAPLAEPRLATIYAADPRDAMNRLGLRPADTGANVLIGQPFDPVVFDRAERDEGVTYARVTQVAADLMTGPGRGPAEGEGLIEWMASNEEAWRIPSTQTT